jgi:nuclear pore complex protein Nup160
MEGNAGEGGSCCYIEAGGGRWFCDGSLDWRDVYISSYSLGGSGTSQGHAHGGSYYFTRQPHRAIYWRANVGTLELIEISMNKDLVGNAVKIHLPQGAGLILSDVGVAELTSHLVIMFATSVTVYRLILPHPEVVAKDSSLSRVGRGYPPSILMFVLNDTITHHPIVEPPSSVPASCVHACCHGDGSCTFVIGTRDSNDTLHSITIPAIGSSILLPVRSIMTQHGVIQKLWNILPSVSGRKSGASGDGAGVVSLTGHSFGGEFIVVSIAADGIMRLWSIQQQSCVLEHDLSSYITSSYSKESHIFIKKSATTSESSIRLALSSSIHDVLQVDIFELILLDDQLMLDHIITKSLSINSDDILLKDKWIFDVSLSEVVLWVGVANRDGDLCDIFTCKYDNEVGDEMRRCDLRSLRSHDVSLSSHCDPRESFLHLLFSSGDITTSAIMKGLMLYGFKCNSADSIDILRKNVICKVEDEVRGVAGSCELDHHEYTQLLIKCWNKFYNCCQQYEQLLWKPLGLSHDDGTGLVSLIHGGSLSFLAPYHGTTPTDSLWEAVELVRKELSDEVLQSYIDDIMESSSFSLSSLLNHDIKDEIRKLCSVMDDDGLMMDRLHGYIRSIDIKREESHDQEMMSHDPSLLDSLPDASAFFKLVVSTLRQVCLKRLKLCRDLLIICHVIQSFNIMESTQLKHYIDKLCNLSNNYHIIYWMCNYNCTLTTSGRSSLLSGVLQLAEMPDPSTVNNTNILLLYLINNSHTLYTKIFSRCIERDHLHWDNLLPWLLDGLLLHLWPRDNVVLLYEMFLSCYQYGGLHILHDHCQKLDRSKAHQDGGTHLLMGYACIGLGLIDDSIKHFIDGGREMTTSVGGTLSFIIL